jgi:IS5 family transposase
LDGYIPDKHFRRRDPRYAAQRRHWPKKKRFSLENFDYDEAADEYICPNGKRLKCHIKTAYAKGIVQRRYVAEETDCKSCPLRARCIAVKAGKRRCLGVPIAVALNNLSKRMAGKIDTEMGRKIYPQRIAIAEPVFANIRTQKRLDRFNLRGKIKVNIQWMLYCMIHNIEKIVNYGVA